MTTKHKLRKLTGRIDNRTRSADSPRLAESGNLGERTRKVKRKVINNGPKSKSPNKSQSCRAQFFCWLQETSVKQCDSGPAWRRTRIGNRKQVRGDRLGLTVDSATQRWTRRPTPGKSESVVPNSGSEPETLIYLVLRALHDSSLLVLRLPHLM